MRGCRHARQHWQQTKVMNPGQSLRRDTKIHKPGPHTNPWVTNYVVLCISVENRDWKEWHWSGSQGLPGWPKSSVRRDGPEAQSSLASRLAGDWWARSSLSPALLPLALGAQWRAHSPDVGCGLKGWQRPHCSRSVAWLVYASSSPADTISRMATGR